jgi:hypothetical protein
VGWCGIQLYNLLDPDPCTGKPKILISSSFPEVKLFDHYCFNTGLPEQRAHQSHSPSYCSTGFATAQDCQSKPNNKNELNNFIDVAMVYSYLLLLRTCREIIQLTYGRILDTYTEVIAFYQLNLSRFIHFPVFYPIFRFGIP